MRLRELVMRRSQNQTRLRQLNIELMNLKRYVENIADGKISLFEMMNTPTSMFGRQLQFMQYSSIFCEQSAINQLGYMRQQQGYNQLIAQNPQYAQAYEQMMYQNCYKEAQTQFAHYEQNLLHQKEGEINGEKDSLETENLAIEAEMKEIKEQRKNEIQQFFSQA